MKAEIIKEKDLNKVIAKRDKEGLIADSMTLTNAGTWRCTFKSKPKEEQPSKEVVKEPTTIKITNTGPSNEIRVHGNKGISKSARKRVKQGR